MELRQLSLEEFGELFPRQFCVYDTPRFCALNATKAEDVGAFTLFDDHGQALLGQVFGLRGGIWRAPYSAPYSFPSGNAIDRIPDFYSLLKEKLGPIHLSFPPQAYLPCEAPAIGQRTDEANFHYPIERFADYELYLSRSGRYSHHRALKHDFRFEKTDDIARAYGIIAENRRAMGYPLAMSLEQVVETVQLVKADFFVLSLDEHDLASAMIYHVRPGVVQVIYWGDLPEARQYRAMNHLAYRVFLWYAENQPDVKIVDIGPASTDGIRNEGLCQFKLSIGCIETPKPIYSL